MYLRSPHACWEGGAAVAGGSGGGANADSLSQQACTYAALILYDLGLDINEDNINKLITAAGITGVKGYWAGLFCKLIESQGMADILANSTKGGGSGGGAAAAGGATGGADGGDAADAAEEEEEEEEEESSAAAGGLFGGSGSSDDDSS